MSGSKILFALTGSIAAYKACEAISGLVQRGHSVRCVASESALRFVGAATLEGLTRAPVATDLFAAGRALEHIDLTRWADLVIVCPATANTVNRFAAGLADDLLGALFLAHDRAKPWLIAPAMNPAMWTHPATAAAVAKLRDWGIRFVSVGEGRTACGELGEGRLAEPEQIVEAVAAALARPRRRQHVLVTAGGTAEPVDGVRVLTNTSTGATGAAIATHWARAGHDVVLLRARNAVAADGPCREETFGTFAELASALGRLLAGESFDVVIHAAAVSDYSVDLVQAGGGVVPASAQGKLESGQAPLLRLRPNPRLVDQLRAFAPAPLKVVAFKLTNGASPEEVASAVAKLFAHSGADFVVHNDLSRRVSGEDFPADIHRADGAPVRHCPDRSSLARALEELLTDEESAGVSRHAARP